MCIPLKNFLSSALNCKSVDCRADNFKNCFFRSVHARLMRLSFSGNTDVSRVLRSVFISVYLYRWIHTGFSIVLTMERGF